MNSLSGQNAGLLIRVGMMSAPRRFGKPPRVTGDVIKARVALSARLTLARSARTFPPS